MIAQNKITDREVLRARACLQLEQASEIKDAVQRYLEGRSVEEVAELTGLPQSLVQNLENDDVGMLCDAIEWIQRSNGGEVRNDITRTELRKAGQLKDRVEMLGKCRSVHKIAELTGLPMTLIGELKRIGDAASLYDCILWIRRTED